MRGKRLFQIIILPVLAALAGSLLLYAAAWIPDGSVRANAEISAAQLLSKSETVTDNGRMAYIMDYNTDAIMMMESVTLDRREPLSVWLNPMVWLGETMQRDSFAAFCAGAEPNTFYVRYWMGYRLLYRPLLTAFSYDSITWVLSLIFLSLSVLALTGIAGKRGAPTAAAFGLSLALVNPLVVAHSPQFASCFLLCFAALLWLLKRGGRVSLPLFFCGVGTMTQFFDFYTAPVVTLGIPLLLCVEMEHEDVRRLGGVLRAVADWLYGYVGMWIVKLTLTTLFTPVNGLENGLVSLRGRLDLTQVRDGAQYSAGKALRAVWETVFPGGLALPALLLLAIALVFALLYLIRVKDRGKRDAALAELCVSMLPIVWFSVAAQPTCIHAWFQYRGICVSFCGLMLVLRRALRGIGIRA